MPLTVMPSELASQVKDSFGFVGAEDTLKLAVLGDIGAHERAGLKLAVLQVAARNLVLAPLKLGDEGATERPK